MERVDLDIIEFWSELNSKNRAVELGVDYQVKANLKERGLDVLVRIKNGNDNNRVFADFIGKLINDKYRCDVRFSYPTKF